MKILNILCLMPLLILSGCTRGEELSPPTNGETVKISVVKPVDVDILPMGIIYRSEKCRDKIFTSSGGITTRAGYHLLTVPFYKETGSYRVSSSIAIDGGGRCEWKLSNIKFDFKYHNMKHFGGSVKNNIPADIVFVFDKNAPPRGDGNYDNVYGAVEIEKNYFPLIRKNSAEDTLTLTIKGQPMLTYRVYDANSIVFKPAFHPDMLVTAIPPAKKGEGFTLIYPYGEKIVDHHFPNSEKTKYDFVKQKLAK